MDASSQQENYREARRYAEEAHEESLALLRTLAQMPSPTRHEDRRASFIEDWLRTQGAMATIDAAKNVVCPIGDDGNKPLVVLAAHADVVFDDETTLPLVEDEDIWRALGVGDDTANLVNLLMTAKYLLKHPVTSDMGYLVVANSCEEGLGNLYGTRQIFSDWGGRVKEYLSFDCYAGMIVNHAVGSHRFRISADVQGGHSYVNFGRPNAIKVFADVLEDLCALEIPEHPKTTFNVGTFEGGVSVNAIAEHAEMLFEYRSAFDAVLARMDGELARVVEGHIRPGVHLMHEAIGTRPGDGELEEGPLSDLTSRSVEAYRAAFGKEPDVQSNSTDASIPLSLGIPANTVGTIMGAGAHTREEWIDTKSMVPGLALVLSLALGYRS